MTVLIHYYDTNYELKSLSRTYINSSWGAKDERSKQYPFLRDFPRDFHGKPTSESKRRRDRFNNVENKAPFYLSLLINLKYVLAQRRRIIAL